MMHDALSKIRRPVVPTISDKRSDIDTARKQSTRIQSGLRRLGRNDLADYGRAPRSGRQVVVIPWSAGVGEQRSGVSRYMKNRWEHRVTGWTSLCFVA